MCFCYVRRHGNKLLSSLDLELFVFLLIDVFSNYYVIFNTDGHMKSIFTCPKYWWFVSRVINFKHMLFYVHYKKSILFHIIEHSCLCFDWCFLKCFWKNKKLSQFFGIVWSGIFGEIVIYYWIWKLLLVTKVFRSWTSLFLKKMSIKRCCSYLCICIVIENMIYYIFSSHWINFNNSWQTALLGEEKLEMVPFFYKEG